MNIRDVGVALTRRLAMFTAIALAGLGALSAHAHHSFAMYDGSMYRVFTGVVVRVVPSAAHFEMHFVPLNEARDALVRDEDGDPEVWVVEMQSAGRVARDGITLENFPQGTVISVGLHPLRSGKLGGDKGGSGLYRCPTDVVPEPGMHCDSVEGSDVFGAGVLPAEGPILPDSH